MLQIYDTKSKRKIKFEPLEKDKVSLYVCGVTVYDYCHIGHAKTYITFDIINRYLKYSGYEVKYVRNITDIDDKIINKANQEGVSFNTIRNQYINIMHEDFARLNLLQPTYEPKATEFIPHMVDFIKILIDKGYAYVADNNDVYYDVRQFKQYGHLSNRKLEDMQAGARVSVADVKKYPFDFVLWKQSKTGEPSWESPWGQGRPGWHLECSVMAKNFLGDTFDLHGGGADLVFPHHENECAQSIAASDTNFVNNWLHVGFLQINQEKMSKSLGNFTTIRNTLREIHPEVLRYSMISGHYRSPLEYSEDLIINSKNSLKRFYQCLRQVDLLSFNTLKKTKDKKIENTDIKKIWKDKFKVAMDDDFNTPKALAVLFELVKEINCNLENKDTDKTILLTKILKEFGNILGLLYYSPDDILTSDIRKNIDSDYIEELIAKRNQARKNKDWVLSDQIRDELAKKGIVLEDKENGTIWRVD